MLCPRCFTTGWGKTCKTSLGAPPPRTPPICSRSIPPPGSSPHPRGQGGGRGGRGVTRGFLLDLVSSSPLAALRDGDRLSLPDPAEVVGRIREFLKDKLAFFDRVRDDLASLVAADDPQSIGGAASEI